MTIRLETVTRNAGLDAIDAAINTGSGTTGGTLEIFVGAVNGTFGTNPAGALITSITLNATAFAAASAGAMVATNSTPDGTASPSPLVAGCFVISDRDGAHILDGNVGTSGTDLILTDVNIGSGVVISIPTITLTAGNAA